MKKRRLREDLVPYLPEQLAGARYEDGCLYTELTASEYHSAVMHAMCKKQRLESDTPDVPVLSFDVIKSIRRFSTAYRVIKTHGDGFVPLYSDADKLNRLYFLSLPGSDPMGYAKRPDMTTRAANVTDAAAIRTAAKNLPPVPDGVIGRYCVPVRFDAPIGVDKRHREYNGACYVLENGNIQNIFPFMAD